MKTLCSRFLELMEASKKLTPSDPISAGARYFARQEDSGSRLIFENSRCMLPIIQPENDNICEPDPLAPALASPVPNLSSTKVLENQSHSLARAHPSGWWQAVGSARATQHRDRTFLLSTNNREWDRFVHGPIIKLSSWSVGLYWLDDRWVRDGFRESNILLFLDSEVAAPIGAVVVVLPALHRLRAHANVVLGGRAEIKWTTINV